MTGSSEQACSISFPLERCWSMSASDQAVRVVPRPTSTRCCSITRPTTRSLCGSRAAIPMSSAVGAKKPRALLDAGHRTEVVPGLSSATAAAAAAGIPLTHRGLSNGFTVVTATSAHDAAGVDWLSLAQIDHTLVVLMGVRLAPHIATALIAGGRSPDEPAAVIGSATTACQQVQRTTLGRLGQVQVPAPATIVIGDVASSRRVAGVARRPSHRPPRQHPPRRSRRHSMTIVDRPAARPRPIPRDTDLAEPFLADIVKWESTTQQYPRRPHRPRRLQDVPADQRCLRPAPRRTQPDGAHQGAVRVDPA